MASSSQSHTFLFTHASKMNGRTDGRPSVPPFAPQKKSNQCAREISDSVSPFPTDQGHRFQFSVKGRGKATFKVSSLTSSPLRRSCGTAPVCRSKEISLLSRVRTTCVNKHVHHSRGTRVGDLSSFHRWKGACTLLLPCRRCSICFRQGCYNNNCRSCVHNGSARCPALQERRKYVLVGVMVRVGVVAVVATAVVVSL